MEDTSLCNGIISDLPNEALHGKCAVHGVEQILQFLFPDLSESQLLQ